jgi:hypothetical protein
VPGCRKETADVKGRAVKVITQRWNGK